MSWGGCGEAGGPRVANELGDVACRGVGVVNEPGVVTEESARSQGLLQRSRGLLRPLQQPLAH